MKAIDETTNYINTKKQVFETLINEIESAQKDGKPNIYVKKLKVLEDEIDIIAQKNEWPEVLQKAQRFFESVEDYEMCQRCKTVKMSLIDKNTKRKSNGKSTKRTKETT